MRRPKTKSGATQGLETLELRIEPADASPVPLRERRDPEKVRLRQELAAAACELDALREQLSKVEADRDWCYAQWQERTGELASIQGSRMWRAWMTYHRLREWILRPLSWTRKQLYGLPRALVGLGAAGGRAVLRGCGWLYLLAWTAAAQLAAVRRRWFAGQKAPAGGESELVSAPRRPRVLMVCPYPIYPPNHGGGVRLYNLIRRIGAACDLQLFIFIRADDDPQQREALEPLVEKLYFHHWRPALKPDRWGLQPRSAQLFDSPKVHRRLCEILSREKIDILQLEFTEMGQYGLRRYARVKVVLSEIDITFRSRARRRAAGFHRRYKADRNFGYSFGDWMRQLRYELKVARRADQVQVMSEDDGDYLASYLEGGRRKIRVVPNAVDTDCYRPARKGSRNRRLLFVGNFQHLPNLDALDYLMAEIWPRVRERVPRAELAVVGAEADGRVTRYHGSEGVMVIGELPDIKPCYQQYRALLAPIRAGSGTRLKILEALACGMPVVSTTLGAEGIAGVDGQHFLLADDPDAFAGAVAEVLANDRLCDRLGREGRQLVEDLYDWDRSARALLEGYGALLAERRAETPRRAPAGRRKGGPETAEISIVIPTLNGGEMLERCLEAISRQKIGRPYEVLCVDSGSPDSDLRTMKRFGARVESIDKADFNHGLTRDLGAEMSSGRVLVYLNQDAVPCDPNWLDRLTARLFDGNDYAAVQGAIQELPDPDQRFFWDSCGERFYFTRESDRWMESFFGIGFSTVNAAIRREVWQRHPFGVAPIMEDKKWQREVVEAGHAIAVEPRAVVFHTHNYDFRSLVRRCESEGFGWRFLGERYSFLDMLRDMAQLRIYREWARGLGSRRIRSGAELLFPWLRPIALFRGNRWSQGVKL